MRIGILPGQYFDAETGLHYNWHRYYDPSTGRYLTPDPIGFAGGMNLYAYVQNDPVNRIDPYGLWPFGAPTSGFDFGKLHVPSKKSVAGQLQQSLEQGGTCESESQANKIANDIVNQVGWGDLSLAQAIMDSLQNGTPLTQAQQTASQNFINKLPAPDRQPINQLLNGTNGGGM